MIYRVLLLLYVIAVVVGTEVFAYLWHRYGAHADYIPGIHDTHRIHHSMGETHEANEDFVWILLLMILFELSIGLGVGARIVPGIIAIVTIIVSLTVFWWNWWIHKAYHQPDHWLNNYSWFSLEKRRHFFHHKHPKLNYGIATHFTDKVLGTWLDTT